MRAHYFQHVPFEGLGSIADWLDAKGYSIGCTQLHAGEPLPAIDEVDFLVIMGGPMSVNDEHLFPWLVEEKQFIRHFISTGKPVLGICLGAQLIATAMGARVYPNAEKEIGWFSLQGTKAGPQDLLFPDQCPAFHWHGETFDLPSGARLLASTEACRNQIFQLGSAVIGMQCHLETTRASAEALVANCADELVAGSFIQGAETILSATDADFELINRQMIRVLEYLHNTGRNNDQ